MLVEKSRASLKLITLYDTDFSGSSTCFLTRRAHAVKRAASQRSGDRDWFSVREPLLAQPYPITWMMQAIIGDKFRPSDICSEQLVRNEK